ncbi:GNAT family N-acetyltransferase [Pyruvatibacter mobilis]|uniref:GNAT family N-acetyltransferase n=1 Tax=Pyruvatibacter mobilis TaxID=1712261 RepID=A0A845QBK2_9HYPH|nr:GNAT family N-acetyltransferase [Pyruvatibacter mobilis]NBG95857.1 GNAT family N-acetyltransferase [Pyruvatibacter mobilis]QJD74994.1 GNAT family N-acetyltransferase [Pyruvatibacter mobilis]GGD11921.1 hypothetical protein GCM10011587_14830 [Pyruvatibacter mobilis]
MSQRTPSLTLISTDTLPTRHAVVGASDSYRVVIAHRMSDCAAAWRLLEQQSSPAIFQTHDWLACWMETVGKAQNAEPRIALVRDDNARLVMILPLMLRTHMGMPVLHWMAEEDADYHAPLALPDFAQTCTGSMMRDILMRVANQVPDAAALCLSKTASEFAGIRAPLSLMPHAPHPSAAHAITLTGDNFEDFYAAARSKSTRKRDRQRRRQLEKHGPVSFEVADTPMRRHQMIDEILAQKAIWLKARGICDPFAQDGVYAFLHRLVDDQAICKQLHISALTVNGEIMAGNMGYVQNERFYAVIGSVTDGDLARHSPGVLHLHELFKWCFANGVKVFDLTVGDEGYKKEWCDSRLDLIDIHVPLSMGGVALTSIARARGYLKRKVKASPRLFTLATDARRLVNRALGQ